MYININLSIFADQLRLRKEGGKRQVYDPLRRKYVAFTPEEFVRQLLIAYLLQEKNYNRNRIAVEKTTTYNGMTKRFDLIVYTPDMEPFMLVECKSSSTPLDRSVFEQVNLYNDSFQAVYLLGTNGLETVCCKMDYVARAYTYLEEIPDYPL